MEPGGAIGIRGVVSQSADLEIREMAIGRQFPGASFREMWPFASRLLASGLLNTVFDKKALTALTLVSTFRFGVAAIVGGRLVFSVTCLAINGYYTRKLPGCRWAEQALDLAPSSGPRR